MPNKLEGAGISWVILGSQTKPYKPPQIEWLLEIIEAAAKAQIPLFMKDNLAPLQKRSFQSGMWFEFRQEVPK